MDELEKEQISRYPIRGYFGHFLGFGGILVIFLGFGGILVIL